MRAPKRGNKKTTQVITVGALASAVVFTRVALWLEFAHQRAAQTNAESV